MVYEYQRFGNGFVRRTEGTTDSWMSCPRDDVPKGFFDDEQRVQVRREVGGDPYYRPEIADDEELLPAGPGVFAVRRKNAAAEAVAEELGLTANELRSRLTTGKGGTAKRVDDKRFDKLMADVGVDPQLARERFADRDVEQPSTFDELDHR